MNLREAAQQALEALEEATNYTGCEAWSPSMTDECLAVAVALRAALEQPEQEPMAWLDEEINCAYTPQELDGGSADGLLPLFTHPPRREWRGLDRDETMHLMNDTAENYWADEAHIQRFARAVEAALRSKNHE
jgi:hypothetical protein